MMFVVPFRGVWVLWLVLLVGCLMAAWVNNYGVRLLLLKHCSQEVPVNIGDGIIIEAGIGIRTILFPPLTSLIATHHPEEAKLLPAACICRAQKERVNSEISPD